MKFQDLIEKYGKKTSEGFQIDENLKAEIVEAIQTGLSEHDEIPVAPIVNMACDVHFGESNWTTEDRAKMVTVIRSIVKELGYTWVKSEKRFKSAKIQK